MSCTKRSKAIALARLRTLQDIQEDDSGDSDIGLDAQSDEISGLVRSRRSNNLDECQSTDDYSGESSECSSEDEDRSVTHPFVTGDPESLKLKICMPTREKAPDKNLEPVLYGKDGTAWKKFEFSNPNVGRTPSCNVFTAVPGPSGIARRSIRPESVLSSFRLIFDSAINRIIKSCTESEAKRCGDTSFTISYDELDCFISLHLARAVLCAKNTPWHFCWNKVYGPRIFSETMPRDKFFLIMKYLRFDDKATRSQRLSNDKFCLASAIWNRFISNSQAMYTPGPILSADEQLLPSKCRCPFTQYISTKPDKYGIKFWLLVSTDSKYICNGFPYLGKANDRADGIPIGEHVVLKLMQPFLNKGYHVTCDNYFTSLKLAEKLKDSKTSMTGTIRANRRELPGDLLAADKKAPQFSSSLYKTSSNVSLTSYKCKPGKSVYLISTYHNTCSAGEAPKYKPETVAFYNKSKYGVDIADQMCRLYTTKCGSRRWPVHVFYNVLDMSVINAWILFCFSTGDKIPRRDFILRLIEELNSLGVSDSDSFALRQNNREPRAIAKVRRQCHSALCRNKTTNQCELCHKYICGKCTSRTNFFCNNCA